MSNRLSSQDVGYQSGDLSLFPTVLDDRDVLYVATNNATTTLKQTLTYNGKIVVVEDTSAFPSTGQIRIGYEGGDYEFVAYQKKTPNTFQELQRGFGGSKQNVWPPGKTKVTNSVMADHHNALKDAIVNLEKDLGTAEQPESESLNGILKSQEVRFLSPKPLFRAFPKKGVPDLSVRFQNFTTGHIIRYFWDFGDGSTSLEKSPTHTYRAEGKYSVKLNVITSTGAHGVQTKKDYITVSNDETVPFFYVESVSSPYSIETAAALTIGGDPTEPKTFTFVDQSDGDILQRNWVFGDGNQHIEEDPDVHTISHTYAKPGNYVVTLLVVLANSRLKRVELPDQLVVL